VIIAAVILFTVALAFLAAELFVPSHGVLGVVAILCAIGGVVLSYRASPILGILSAILLVIIAPIVFYWAIKLYPQTPVGKRVLLNGPDHQVTNPFDSEVQKLATLVGKRGITMTTLRPAGSVELEGRRIDCMSESEVIPPNTPVEVLRVAGLKVIVKAVV